LAVGIIEKSFGRPLDKIFSSFDQAPIASASIAQVHFAVLPSGREVAVKVLRPNMKPAIEKDLALMHMMAGWVEGASADGKRLKPREVIAEFDKYLHDELDLLREAASGAQLRRNMAGLDLVMIPEMIWDYCMTDVMVMERMLNGRLVLMMRVTSLTRPTRSEPLRRIPARKASSSCSVHLARTIRLP